MNSTIGNSNIVIFINSVIIRYSGLVDEEEDNETENHGIFGQMYGRLFAPDSILVRGDEDMIQTQEVSNMNLSIF